jgi:chitin disaccharide deacetylase
VPTRLRERVPSLKSLIVNADDLGASRGVNHGIIEAHEHGIVTSASLMVYGSAAAEAAEFARGSSKLGLGLHVELRRWRMSLVPGRGAALSAAGIRRHVSRELHRQLERFRLLVGRDPTHLDSHQHRHTWPLTQPMFERTARELRIPLRRTALGVRFCGDFYGHDGRGRPDPDAITSEALIQLLEQIPEGATELCCHPGYVGDLNEWYRVEREQEVRVLCDPRVQDAVHRRAITLCTFADLPPTHRPF